MLEARRTAAAQPPPRSPGVLRVPLFSGLVAHLRDGTRRVILDLGPARSGMISFCSQAGCRLDIAHVEPGLASLNNQKDSIELLCQAEALLPARGRDPVDVVLCWDLLNYLGRRPLAALMERIAKRCRKGALVHALIVYSKPKMPAQPQAWFPAFEAAGAAVPEPRPPSAGPITRSQSAATAARPKAPAPEIGLLTTPAGSGEKDAPRYTPDDLRRCLPAYTIDRGMLLNNGMQEFLFRV